MSGVLHALTMTSSTGASDSLLASNVLLLKTIATNNATNASFVDSSSNNFTVTRTGDVTQGSFSPYAPTGYWSNYFDGNGDYLALPSSSGQLGAGNFTVEMWAFPVTKTSSFPCLFSNYNNFSTGSFAIFADHNSSAGWTLAVNGTFPLINGGAVIYNQWTHLAVTRVGSTMTLYVNGVASGTATMSATLNGNGTSTYIGTAGEIIPQSFNGFISDVRIVGSAVYTSNFTPPTSPLTAVSGTSLLTCQDNRFIDRSSNNFTLTRTGDVSVRRFAPFGLSWDGSLGGSGYFDGSGDWLTVGSNAAFGPGTGSFTIEAWVYPMSVPAGYSAISRNSGGTNGIFVGFNGANTIVHNVGIGDLISSATFPPINAWAHIAAVRNSGTLSLFVNGTRVGTVSNSTSFPTNDLVVGGVNAFHGHISNYRFVNGSAVYDPTQTTLTVPTSPVTAISGTSLLLNFDNAAVYDATRSSNLTLNGTTQTSTAQKNYADTSVALSTAAGNRGLQTVDRPELRFGTGDFTAELWWRPSGLSGYQTIINKGYSGTGGFALQTELNNGRINVVLNGSVVITAPANRAVTDATWNHIAVVRSAGTVTLWVNGLSAGSGSSSADLSSTADLQIGWETQVGNVYPASGNVEDVRFSRTARYTSAFTPPARALPVTAG